MPEPQVTVRTTAEGRVTEVVVPEEFRAIGFSGLFHTETALEGGPEVIEAWAAKVPCLIHADKWMLLSVDREAGTGVVVRRDDCAIVEAFTRRAGRAGEAG